MASARALMAVGRERAPTANDETSSSGKAPLTEKSTRAWAILAVGESELVMADGVCRPACEGDAQWQMRCRGHLSFPVRPRATVMLFPSRRGKLEGLRSAAIVTALQSWCWGFWHAMRVTLASLSGTCLQLEAEVQSSRLRALVPGL